MILSINVEKEFLDRWANESGYAEHFRWELIRYPERWDFKLVPTARRDSHQLELSPSRKLGASTVETLLEEYNKEVKEKEKK